MLPSRISKVGETSEQHSSSSFRIYSQRTQWISYPTPPPEKEGVRRKCSKLPLKFTTKIQSLDRPNGYLVPAEKPVFLLLFLEGTKTQFKFSKKSSPFYNTSLMCYSAFLFSFDLSYFKNKYKCFIS